MIYTPVMACLDMDVGCVQLLLGLAAQFCSEAASMA